MSAPTDVEDFMASPRYDEVVELLDRSAGEASAAESALPTEPVPSASVPVEAQPGPQDRAGAGNGVAAGAGILARESIVLAGTATTRGEAIVEAGRLLVAAGAVPEAYVAAMLEREQSVSTHMGNGLAIPHGTNEAKGLIRRTAISFVRYPGGLDWNGKPAEFVLGIAGAGDDHLQVLAKVAEIFLDADQVEQLRTATSPEEIHARLGDLSV